MFPRTLCLFGMPLLLIFGEFTGTYGLHCYSGNTDVDGGRQGEVVEVACQEGIVNCLKEVSIDDYGGHFYDYGCGSKETKPSGCSNLQSNPSIQKDALTKKPVKTISKQSTTKMTSKLHTENHNESLVTKKEKIQTTIAPSSHKPKNSEEISEVNEKWMEEVKKKLPMPSRASSSSLDEFVNEDDSDWSNKAQSNVNHSLRKREIGSQSYLCYCDQDLCNGAVKSSTLGLVVIFFSSLCLKYVLS